MNMLPGLILTLFCALLCGCETPAQKAASEAAVEARICAQMEVWKMRGLTPMQAWAMTAQTELARMDAAAARRAEVRSRFAAAGAAVSAGMKESAGVQMRTLEESRRRTEAQRMQGSLYNIEGSLRRIESGGRGYHAPVFRGY